MGKGHCQDGKSKQSCWEEERLRGGEGGDDSGTREVATGTGFRRTQYAGECPWTGGGRAHLLGRREGEKDKMGVKPPKR